MFLASAPQYVEAPQSTRQRQGGDANKCGTSSDLELQVVAVHCSCHSDHMSKVVFVGNVPYNMGEEQLIEVFKSVGQVVGFRLVFDRDTGKPKGYGFCEFAGTSIYFR